MSLARRRGSGTCAGSISLSSRAPLAQRQSNGLLIRRFWVRIPGGALEKLQVRGVKDRRPVSRLAHSVKVRDTGQWYLCITDRDTVGLWPERSLFDSMMKLTRPCDPLKRQG